MKYYRLVNDKFIYTDVPDKLYHEIINKDKFGGDDTKIEIIGEFEEKFVKSLELDEKVIYWNYNSIDIKFENTFTEEIEIYQPKYYVIFKNGLDGTKIGIFDIEEYPLIDIEKLEEDELDSMEEAELEEYFGMIDQMEYTLAKYISGKKYCDKNGMKFFVITDTGVRVIDEEKKLMYN